MSSIPVSNPPSDLTMRDLQAVSSAYGGLARSCRWVARIIPQGEYLVKAGYTDFMKQLPYLCEVAEMPGRTFMNIGHSYYGPDFKIPFQSVYEDITMTFLCRTQSYERQFFDDWMEIINPTNLWDFNYRDQYMAEIQVYQLADFGTSAAATAPAAMYMWSLYQAFPIVVNAQPVTWADDAIQRLTVSFTYDHWSRKGWDREPRGPDANRFVIGSQVTGLPIVNPI